MGVSEKQGHSEICAFGASSVVGDERLGLIVQCLICADQQSGVCALKELSPQGHQA